ncbi:hypothetical protein HELRODRAFT_193297 [Helobdella robusta]|uniref:Uncharacterized protein n=1 Tax=Helobdella robusta TaxID=6412 RepID=T1FUU7_HELRO|nr:hypothetical protein HELRODRAFT_193297 [Helobdella robusta]ESN97197.1 hypothetical protein HELRODRAFT_193297 [Helobdella robusta]
MEDETTSRRVDGADGEDRLNGGNGRRGRKILFLVMAGSGMIGAVVCTTLVASVLAAADFTACERRDATSEYEKIYSDPTRIEINGRLIFLWTSFVPASAKCVTNDYTTFFMFKSAQSQQLIRFSLSMENVADYCSFASSTTNGLTYSKDPAVPLYNNQSIPEDAISGGNYTFNSIAFAFNPSNNQTNTTFDFIKIEVAYRYVIMKRHHPSGAQKRKILKSRRE